MVMDIELFELIRSKIPLIFRNILNIFIIIYFEMAKIYILRFIIYRLVVRLFGYIFGKIIRLIIYRYFFLHLNIINYREFAYKYCYNIFTMDFALETHFRIISRLILFYRWLSNRHYDAVVPSIEFCLEILDNTLFSN